MSNVCWRATRAPCGSFSFLSVLRSESCGSQAIPFRESRHELGRVSISTAAEMLINYAYKYWDCVEDSCCFSSCFSFSSFACRDEGRIGTVNGHRLSCLGPVNNPHCDGGFRATTAISLVRPQQQVIINATMKKGTKTYLSPASSTLLLSGTDLDIAHGMFFYRLYPLWKICKSLFEKLN